MDSCKEFWINLGYLLELNWIPHRFQYMFSSCFLGLCCASGALVFWAILSPFCDQNYSYNDCCMAHLWAHSAAKATATMIAAWLILEPTLRPKLQLQWLLHGSSLSPLCGQSYSYNDCCMAHPWATLRPKLQLQWLLHGSSLSPLCGHSTALFLSPSLFPFSFLSSVSLSHLGMIWYDNMVWCDWYFWKQCYIYNIYVYK